MPEEFVARLREICGVAGVLVGADARARAGAVLTGGTTAADVVVRPQTTAAVAAVLALCNDARRNVVVQGGMTGLVRGTQTAAGDVVLSLERLHRILAIDPLNRTATVEAGVVLQQLEEALEPHGLSFALDLGARGSCQLGGNAATNAGGIHVIRYGMMREQILGLEVVLADGRIVPAMNHMIKNNTGYDLKQLFIGSEGTLGVITKLVLRLRERPLARNTALVSVAGFPEIAALLRLMDQRLGGLLGAFELVDGPFYRLNTDDGRSGAPLAADSPYYAIIEALGSDAARDRELFEQALAEAAAQQLLRDAVLAGSERERSQIWAIRERLENIPRLFQPPHAFDVSLPVGEMERYMETVRARIAAECSDGRVIFFGHVGDGNLHVVAGSARADEVGRLEACVYEPLAPFQGSVSAEHGIGLEKQPWLHVSRSAAELEVMRALKRLFDPNDILNRGKLLPPA